MRVNPVNVVKDIQPDLLRHPVVADDTVDAAVGDDVGNLVEISRPPNGNPIVFTPEILRHHPDEIWLGGGVKSMDCLRLGGR